MNAALITYVPPDHCVTLSSTGINFSVRHQDLFDRMRITGPCGNIYLLPILTMRAKSLMSFTLNLSVVKQYFPSLTALKNITLKLSQQFFESQSHFPLIVDLSNYDFTIEGDRLHVCKKVNFTDCVSSLNQLSLFNLSVRINKIWIKEIITDIALFETHQQKKLFCFHKELNESNTLYQLKPFWYNSETKERLNKFANQQANMQKKVSHEGAYVPHGQVMDLVGVSHFSSFLKIQEPYLKVIENLSMGIFLTQPFTFSALVNHTKLFIKLTVNLEVLEPYFNLTKELIKGPLNVNLELIQTNSGSPLFPNGYVLRSNVRFYDYMIKGNQLLIDKTFDLHLESDAELQTLWNLGLEINGISFSPIVRDIVIFPASSIKEGFKKQKLACNPVLKELKPFWHVKLTEEKSKNPANREKRTRKEVKQGPLPVSSKNSDSIKKSRIEETHEELPCIVDSQSNQGINQSNNPSLAPLFDDIFQGLELKDWAYSEDPEDLGEDMLFDSLMEFDVAGQNENDLF